jgi:hypothetical protein
MGSRKNPVCVIRVSKARKWSFQRFERLEKSITYVFSIGRFRSTPTASTIKPAISN